MPTPAVTKAARLHRLAALLESQASSAADLAKHFRVGKRTIHRDLHELESLGHLVETRGRRYAIRP
nr:HTH domain-containing protein [Gemmatimonadaceae bacterium]